MEIVEMRKDIATLQIKLAELNVEGSAQSNEARESKNHIKTLEKEIVSTRNKALQIYTDIENLKIQANQAHLEIRELEESISQREFKDAVKVFMDKQQDVWKVIQNRVEIAQKEANAGVVGCETTIKPEDFVKRLKTEINALHNFGQIAILTREVVGLYSKALNDIAETQANGGRVDLKQKRAPQDYVDRFLQIGIVQDRWNL